MDRKKLLLLVVLGVGLFALFARRAAAASAPVLYAPEPESWASLPGPTASPTGSQGWPELDWTWLDSWDEPGGAPTQQAPVSQAPGGEFDWSAEFARDLPPAEAPAPVDESTPDYGFDWYSWESPLPTPTPSGAVDIWSAIPTAPTGGQVVNPYANVAAFLQLIRTSEGTQNNPRGWSPYAVTYAYAFEITDFRDHPALLGWRGVTLPDNYCRAAGLSPGCVSTAAGAYQFISTTWRRLRDRLRLSDFSPVSQDAAAVELLREIGALDHIRAGHLQVALDRAATQWASLPGSTSGQPQITTATAAQLYQQAGGTVT